MFRLVMRACFVMFLVGGTAVVLAAGLQPGLPHVKVVQSVTSRHGFRIARRDFVVTPPDAPMVGRFIYDDGDLLGRAASHLDLSFGRSPDVRGRPLKTLMVFPAFDEGR